MNVQGSCCVVWPRSVSAARTAVSHSPSLLCILTSSSLINRFAHALSLLLSSLSLYLTLALVFSLTLCSIYSVLSHSLSRALLFSHALPHYRSCSHSPSHTLFFFSLSLSQQTLYQHLVDIVAAEPTTSTTSSTSSTSTTSTSTTTTTSPTSTSTSTSPTSTSTSTSPPTKTPSVTVHEPAHSAQAHQLHPVQPRYTPGRSVCATCLGLHALIERPSFAAEVAAALHGDSRVFTSFRVDLKLPAATLLRRYTVQQHFRPGSPLDSALKLKSLMQTRLGVLLSRALGCARHPDSGLRLGLCFNHVGTRLEYKLLNRLPSADMRPRKRSRLVVTLSSCLFSSTSLSLSSLFLVSCVCTRTPIAVPLTSCL
jgi:hypothetical protein